jgi:hypothetical protein
LALAIERSLSWRSQFALPLGGIFFGRVAYTYVQGYRLELPKYVWMSYFDFSSWANPC